MSVGLLTDCKVGTEGGGTAIPRLDLHSREAGNKYLQLLNNLRFRVYG